MEDARKTDRNMSYGINDCPAEKGEMKEGERVEVLTFQLRCEELKCCSLKSG